MLQPRWDCGEDPNTNPDIGTDPGTGTDPIQQTAMQAHAPIQTPVELPIILHDITDLPPLARYYKTLLIPEFSKY